MASNPSDRASRAGNETPSGVPTDDVFDALSSGDRRRVVSHLYRVDQPVDRDELAERLAERSADGPVDAADVERARVRLHHEHLPKLRDAGLVSYSADGDDAGVRLRVADDVGRVVQRLAQV